MFLSNSTFGEVIKAQVKFKLNAFMGTIVSLIFVQLVGLLLSMNGTGMRGTSINNISINITMVSSDIVVIFVILWAFVVGNMMTTKANDDLSFVASRLSSNLANIIVLCLMSLFAGITIVLSNYLLRIIVLLGDYNYMKSPGISDNPLNSVSSMAVMMVLILLVSAVGYLRGILVQYNKIFIYLFPVLIIAMLVTKFGQSILQYIFIESTSLFVLMVKLICLSIILFAFSIISSNRLEVRS